MDVVRSLGPEPPNGASLANGSGALAAFALASCAAWVYWYGMPLSAGFAALAGLFAALLCLTRPFAVPIPGGAAADASVALRALAAVLLGPVWAALACLPYALLLARGGRLRSVYEAGRTAAGVSLAATAFPAVAGAPLAAGAGDPVAAGGGALAAGLAVVSCDAAAAAGLLVFGYGREARRAWREAVLPCLPPDLAGALAAALAAAALPLYGPAAVPVLALGVLAGHLLARRARGAGDSKQAALSSGMALGAAILEELGRSDGLARRRAAATAIYAADIAREMGLEPRRVERLRVAAFLCDIGKLGLSGDPSSHPERGARMLEEAGLGELAVWVRYHHERPDGRGHPYGLRGPWIPLEARILAVAGAYAALVVGGPRHPATDFEAARRRLCEGAGTGFDGEVVRAFLRVLDTAPPDYRRAAGPRFAYPPPEAPRGASAHEVV